MNQEIVPLHTYFWEKEKRTFRAAVMDWMLVVLLLVLCSGISWQLWAYPRTSKVPLTPQEIATTTMSPCAVNAAFAQFAKNRPIHPEWLAFAEIECAEKKPEDAVLQGQRNALKKYHMLGQ